MLVNLPDNAHLVTDMAFFRTFLKEPQAFRAHVCALRCAFPQTFLLQSRPRIPSNTPVRGRWLLLISLSSDQRFLEVQAPTCSVLRNPRYRSTIISWARKSVVFTGKRAGLWEADTLSSPHKQTLCQEQLEGTIVQPHICPVRGLLYLCQGTKPWGVSLV